MTQLIANLDENNNFRVQLSQNGKTVTTFDKALGGNPAGAGVPDQAMQDIRSSMGRLALAASM